MKFNKYICLTIALMVCSVNFVKAETISQKEALKIAETFFNAAYGQVVTAPKMVWNGRQLTTDRLFAPFYIYNHPKGGFVIVSADTKAYPIIGYSRTNKFDKDKLTDEEKELLSKYAHEIELIRYDSRQPERAISSWRDFRMYIHRILENPYNIPEYDALNEEMKERLESIDRRNNSIMLPSAVEFEIYNPDRWRDYTLEDVLVDAGEEYIPFKFYEDFLAEITKEEQQRIANLEELISPNHPVVTILGGAHYSIKYPSDMKMAVVYSLKGDKMIERYYKDTDVINIDISSLPAGFYVLLSLGNDGRMYGTKIYR